MDWAKLAEDHGRKLAAWVENNYSAVGKAIAIGVGGITALDLIMRGENKARSSYFQSQQRAAFNKEIRERKSSKLLKEAYNYRVEYKPKQEEMILPTYEGLNQELFMRRTNHTNTWGGRRY